MDYDWVLHNLYMQCLSTISSNTQFSRMSECYQHCSLQTLSTVKSESKTNYTFITCYTLYSSSMAFVSYYHQLAPAFYIVSYASFTSLYTMTMLIVVSWIVHLTPILGCSYHLHSSHHFLSTWGAVICSKKITNLS